MIQAVHLDSFDSLLPTHLSLHLPIYTQFIPDLCTVCWVLIHWKSLIVSGMTDFQMTRPGKRKGGGLLLNVKPDLMSRGILDI